MEAAPADLGAGDEALTQPVDHAREEVEVRAELPLGVEGDLDRFAPTRESVSNKMRGPLDEAAAMAPRKLARTGQFISLGSFRPPDGLPERQITAYVPQGASRADRRPALYLFDGQNIFGDEGSFAGGWQLHTAVDRLSPRTNHVPVVIGIGNGGERRIEELSPWSAQGRPARAEAFVGWIVDELVAAATRELPLVSGPVGAAIGGSSMGGLGALYAHYLRPDVFGGAIAMSSAFFVGGGRLFEFLTERPRPIISRVYVDCGLKEGRGRMAALSERVVATLAQKGYPPSQLKLRIDPRGAHNERHWARRIGPALRFMFRR